MSGKIIGYIRVSSADQNLERQLDGLKLDKVFIDKASGKDQLRPGLNALLDYIREGDTLIVHSMDRLARNLVDLRTLVYKLTQQNIIIQFVKESLTFNNDDSPMANLLLSVMGAVAEFERALIRERQLEGIVLAKARGAYKGRKRKLTAEIGAQIDDGLLAGHKKTTIARSLGLTRQSIYVHLQRKRDLI
jgi:DNA invertase Pin-like site-specific DNA recombinase